MSLRPHSTHLYWGAIPEDDYHIAARFQVLYSYEGLDQLEDMAITYAYVMYDNPVKIEILYYHWQLGEWIASPVTRVGTALRNQDKGS